MMYVMSHIKGHGRRKLILACLSSLSLPCCCGRNRINADGRAAALQESSRTPAPDENC